MTETRPGRFVWYELMTSDPAAAITFYGDVAGWTTQKWESGDYNMWMGPQGPLGGVMTLPDAAKQMGAPPHWMGNLEVANVDAAVEKLVAAGGKVYVPAQDMPKVGRFSVVADPQGATVSLFKPESPMGAHDTSKPGEIGWHELMTTDLDAAFRFYSDLVGWEKTGEHDMGPMGNYVLFGRDGKALGGMMTKPKEMQMPSSWLYYIRVADLDAALARAKGREARLLNGPVEVPTGEWIAQLMDPQGAAFALLSGPKAAK